MNQTDANVIANVVENLLEQVPYQKWAKTFMESSGHSPEAIVDAFDALERLSGQDTLFDLEELHGLT